MTKEKCFARAAAFAVAAAMVLVALAPFCAQRAQAATSAAEPAVGAKVAVSTAASKASKAGKPKVAPAKMSLEVGASKAVKVAKGGTYQVTSKTFKSNNPKVAKVGKKSGKVTARKAGTAKVTATVKAKPRKGLKARTFRLVCKVTVVKPASAGGTGNDSRDSRSGSEDASAGADGNMPGPSDRADSGDAVVPGDEPAPDQGADPTDETNPTDGSGPGDATVPGSEEGEDADNASSEAGKILVAYYSGTGNTERISKAIANRLGADTFAITPVQPYTSDDLSYGSSTSRTSRERNDPNRNVELAQVTPDGFAGYDTVLLGYPIWWGGACWVVDNFVKGNDFTGKTVVPFCTSASSPVGSSASDLARMAGTGTWREGVRFSSGASNAEVEQWADGLGLK